jgi:hypothetical protein
VSAKRRAIVCALAFLLLAPCTAARADVTVNVTEPTSEPAVGNDYNVTVISDAGGQPLNPGDLITFTSSSDIAGISLNPGARAENPYHTNNGNANVDVKVDQQSAVSGIIRFKSGKRRAVIIVIGATKVLRIPDSTHAGSRDLTVQMLVSWTEPTRLSPAVTRDFHDWLQSPTPMPWAPSTPNPSGDHGGE